MDLAERVVNEVQHYKVYPIRWVMLLMFASLTMINSCMWISFAPVQKQTSFYYFHGDPNQQAWVNLLSMSYCILYLPGSVLVGWCLNKFGFRNSMLVGITLNTFGAWLRFLSAESNAAPRFSGSGGYAVLLTGACFAGLAQPFFTNTPAKFASNWFAVDQRDVATTIASMLNPIGIAVGSVVSGFAITSTNDNTSLTSVSGFPMLLLIQAIVSTVVLIINFAFFQGNPPTPPSKTKAEHLENGEQESMGKLLAEVKAVMSNKDFVLLFCGFGLGLGLFNCLTTIIQAIISPCMTVAGGNSDDAASIISAALLGTGMVACGCVGFLLDYTHKYNQFLKAHFILAVIASLFCFGMFKPGHSDLIIVGFAMMGGCMLPLLPICFECGIEVTFPAPEEISSGLLMTAGQYSGVVLTYILTPMLQSEALNPHTASCTTITLPSSLLIVLLIVVCNVFIFFYNGPYKRLRAETNKNSDSDDFPAKMSSRTSGDFQAL